MRPYFVEGHGIKVDAKARLFVGVESLRQFDGSKRMGLRLGQKIVDASYAILMGLHERCDALPDPTRAYLAAEIETTRSHPAEVTSFKDRADDTVFLYPERIVRDLGEDLVASLRNRGVAMEVLYTKISGAPESHSGLLESIGAEESDQSERPGRDSMEVSSVRERTAQEVLAQTPGSVPEGLLLWAKAKSEPTVVPWHVALRRTFSRAAAPRPGLSYESYDNRSDEQVAVDSLYSRLYDSSRVPRIPTSVGLDAMLDIYIDTSSSMSEDELGRVLGQIAPVFRKNKANVRVWAGDTEVQSTGRASNLMDLARHLRGGGGTSFVPAFERWSKMPLASRPKSVMFFTDGCGPAPERPPKGVQVYWVLIGQHQVIPWINGTSEKVGYGKIIRIPCVNEQ
jgi:hypothetical protein